MEYCAVIKKSKLWLFGRIWVIFTDIMLNEHCVVPFLSGSKTGKRICGI